MQVKLNFGTTSTQSNRYKQNNVSFEAKQSETPKYNPEMFKPIGGFSGFATYFAGIGASLLVGKTIKPLLPKESKALSLEERTVVNEAIDTALENTGLRANGVSIIPLSKKPLPKISFHKGDKFSLFKPISDIKEIFRVLFHNDLAEGRNAAFFPNANKIVAHDNIKLSAFHEMGHAMNRNFSKFAGRLQKMRMPAMMLAAAPFMMASSFPRKDENNKEHSKAAKESAMINFSFKTTDFFRDNVGKLTFLAMVPVLLEEGLATVKGNKLAKELLPKDLYKKVVKTNALGGLTYIISAIGMAVGARMAINVMDKAQTKFYAEKAKSAV